MVTEKAKAAWRGGLIFVPIFSVSNGRGELFDVIETAERSGMRRLGGKEKGGEVDKIPGGEGVRV